MKKKTTVGSVIIAVVLFLLVVMMPIIGKSYIPQITNGVDLPGDKAQAILSVEQGYYNSNLPLFARKIQILENTNDRILYRVYYFPFGSIERSYTKEPDGNWIFNLERSLFGLN